MPDIEVESAVLLLISASRSLLERARRAPSPVVRTILKTYADALLADARSLLRKET